MKPFLTGRREVSIPPLQAINAGAPTEMRARAQAHTHAAGEDKRAPTVECIKQGDKIARLIVTCACGERIEIDCLYPAGG